MAGPDVVTDPRNARSLRYRLPLLLALAVLAVAAGAKTFLEIAEYAADLPVWFVAELGVCSWSGTPSGVDLRAGAGQGRS
ncbi:transposase family protein [Saccharopolyspora sp. ASAGF58]|uniref:transposase family protein n=1 Tax=Saccharopolyspora sp. ASAGF58 TaxID=2719023 RepID=UPI0014451644|nr:transposase family protein [Saccharopolyspora sp. ASAGF58]